MIEVHVNWSRNNTMIAGNTYIIPDEASCFFRMAGVPQSSLVELDNDSFNVLYTKLYALYSNEEGLPADALPGFLVVPTTGYHLEHLLTYLGQFYAVKLLGWNAQITWFKIRY